MILELNSSSLIARFYRWSYNRQDMPASVCVYFWKLLLALGLAPITIPGFWITLNPLELKGLRHRLLCGAATWIAIGFVGGLSHAVYQSPMGALIALGAAVSFIVLTLGITYLVCEFDEIGESIGKYEAVKITKAYVKAVSDKVCPIIHWNTNEELRS